MCDPVKGITAVYIGEYGSAKNALHKIWGSLGASNNDAGFVAV